MKKGLTDYIGKIYIESDYDSGIQALESMRHQLLNLMTDIKNTVYDLAAKEGHNSIYNDADAYWISRIFQAITKESKYGTVHQLCLDDTIEELKNITRERKQV